MVCLKNDRMVDLQYTSENFKGKAEDLTWKIAFEDVDSVAETSNEN